MLDSTAETYLSWKSAHPLYGNALAWKRREQREIGSKLRH